MHACTTLHWGNQQDHWKLVFDTPDAQIAEYPPRLGSIQTLQGVLCAVIVHLLTRTLQTGAPGCEITHTQSVFEVLVPVSLGKVTKFKKSILKIKLSADAKSFP